MRDNLPVYNVTGLAEVVQKHGARLLYHIPLFAGL